MPSYDVHGKQLFFILNHFKNQLIFAKLQVYYSSPTLFKTH